MMLQGRHKYRFRAATKL